VTAAPVLDTRHDGLQFGLVELDLLATHAGVPFPYPLRVPSCGRDVAETERLLAEAGHALQVRGLAAAHGPVGVAADLVSALREHRGTVDLVVVGATGTATGVVAMPDRAGSLLCGQEFGGGLGPVWVRRVPGHVLTDELAAVVPDVQAAPALPITLPPGAVREALRVLGTDTGEPDEDATRQRLRDLLRTHGGDPGGVDLLTELLGTVTGRGQLGATRRTMAGSGRAGPELSWLDGPRGRVCVVHTGDGWTSVNPLRRGEFLQALSEAAMTARGAG